MNYTWINTVGLQTVLRLLSSSPPELTVKELRENVIKEVLFGDYRNYRSESGRWHTNWRTRIYALLMNTPNLPEELIRKGVERIFEDSQWFHIVDWTAKLWFVPNLPEELKDKYFKINHQHFSAPKKVKRVLDNFLPLWLATSSMAWNIDFREEGGVPLFGNSGSWELWDENNRGALICCQHSYSRRGGPTKIVLLPDVSNGNHGIAIEVSSRVKTVHEARAWMFHRDPEKWKGFDREV